MKRGYEKEFDILLRNSNFDIIKSSLFIRDFSIKEITYEIDHLTQRKNILFVFEGKLKNIEKAKKKIFKKKKKNFLFEFNILERNRIVFVKFFYRYMDENRFKEQYCFEFGGGELWEKGRGVVNQKSATGRFIYRNCKRECRLEYELNEKTNYLNVKVDMPEELYVDFKQRIKSLIVKD